MGRRGPQPVPTETLLARGSKLAKGRADNQPGVDGLPVAPKGLGKRPKQVWDVVVRRLSEMGIVGEIDTDALTLYSRTWADWEVCRAWVDEHGMIYETVTAQGVTIFREYPQVGRMEKLHNQLVKLHERFGMTPAARASIGATLSEVQRNMSQANADPRDEYRLTG